MRPPFNLGRLSWMRREGKAPQLPICVTNSRVFEANMTHVGALPILVQTVDAVADWWAVGGLRVILAIPETDAWLPLMKAIRDCNPRELHLLTDDGLTTMWGKP